MFAFVVSDSSCGALIEFQLFSLYCFLVVLGPENPSLVQLIDGTRTENNFHYTHMTAI